MELFEEIRPEHAHEAGSIRAVARKLGMHRRMVRQAVLGAIPVMAKQSEPIVQGSRKRVPLNGEWEMRINSAPYRASLKRLTSS